MRSFKSDPVSPRDPAAGFTLIEIVMVLVLLGILAAVAVPKYFDLQEESQAKVCLHNRQVALNTVLGNFASSRLGGDNAFDASSEEKAIQSAQAIVDELKNSSNEALCPKNGKYTAKANVKDDVYSFEISCSDPAHEDVTNTVDSNTKPSPSNLSSVLPSSSFYQKDITGADCSGKGDLCFTSLESFFTTWNAGTDPEHPKDNGFIDSEAAGKTFTNNGDNYGEFTSMTDAVMSALPAELKTGDMIWSLYRTGSCPDSNGCKEKGYTGAVYLLVTSKTDGLKKGDKVETYVYSASYEYEPNNQGGKLKKIDSFKKEEKTIEGVIQEKWDNKGQSYLTLRRSVLPDAQQDSSI